MKNLFTVIRRANSNRKLKLISQYFPKGKQTLLDFGCGDLMLAKEISNKFPNLQITGLDVVDFGYRYKNIKFVKYDGISLPFNRNFFDVLVAYHVFHHCFNPRHIFMLCTQVTKYRLIIVEPVFRFIWEIPLMMILDCLLNIWKEKRIALNFKFQTLDKWLDIFRENKLEIIAIKPVDVFPKWLPFGRSYLFVLEI